MTSIIQTNPAVHSLFKQANDILGYDLQSLCLKGPDDLLRKTEYCQPAVVVCSLAAAAAAAHKVSRYTWMGDEVFRVHVVFKDILHHMITSCE